MSETRRDIVASASLIARVKREIAADRRAMVRHHRDAVEVAGRLPAGAQPQRADLAWAATALHAWYTALESILERVARHLDANVPAGEWWHQELLSQAMAEVPGVRRALLPESLEGDLLEILGFRRFFRHAYAVDLDPDRLRQLVHRLIAVASVVDSSLDAFAEFLREGQQSVPQ